MDVKIPKTTLEMQTDDFVVDFETEKTPVRLGKSDRYFYMDFNDTNFPVRLKEAREEIGSFLEEKRKELGVEDVSQLKSKTPSLEDIEKTIAISNEIDSFIKRKIDFIFGYNISDTVFGSASSVSVTRNGDYYFDNFLNSVLPLVEREYNVRLKVANEKVKSYTDRKGMHPALKK